MTQRNALRVGLALSLCWGLITPAGANNLSGVAKQLSKGLVSLQPRRIAVLPFPYHNGDMSSGSSIVSERLTTLMVERGEVQVVERALLNKTLGEIRLGMTGVLDPATTQKLGKVLGVPAIVTGTLIDLEDHTTEVNARLIDTETGAILSAAKGRVPRSWTDLPVPPRPTPVSTAPSGDGDEGYRLIASKAIPNSSPRQRGAPVRYVDIGSPMDAPRTGETSSTEDVLTLTNDDLVPVSHRGQTDPERIVNDFLSESLPPSNAVRIARRIYHRDPNPQIRGRALLAMGHLLERSGRPDQASQAYAQILREFPDAPALQTEARHQLNALAAR